MKGQYLTIEHVFFFAMGITMAVMIFAAFSGIADSIRLQATRSQLTSIGDYIRGGITEAYTAGNSTGSYVMITLDIPTSVSGSDYAISIEDNQLRLSGGGSSSNLNLYGIESTIKNKAVFSGRGKVSISYSAGMVYLE